MSRLIREVIVKRPRKGCDYCGSLVGPQRVQTVAGDESIYDWRVCRCCDVVEDAYVAANGWSDEDDDWVVYVDEWLADAYPTVHIAKWGTEEEDHLSGPDCRWLGWTPERVKDALL